MRYAVVKGVSSGDSVTMQNAVTAAGGTFIGHDLTTLNFNASFDTDAEGKAFLDAAVIIDAAYADIDWDPLQALRVNQGKV